MTAAFNAGLQHLLFWKQSPCGPEGSTIWWSTSGGDRQACLPLVAPVLVRLARCPLIVCRPVPLFLLVRHGGTTTAHWAGGLCRARRAGTPGSTACLLIVLVMLAFAAWCLHWCQPGRQSQSCLASFRRERFVPLPASKLWACRHFRCLEGISW